MQNRDTDDVVEKEVALLTFQTWHVRHSYPKVHDEVGCFRFRLLVEWRMYHSDLSSAFPGGPELSGAWTRARSGRTGSPGAPDSQARRPRAARSDYPFSSVPEWQPRRRRRNHRRPRPRCCCCCWQRKTTTVSPPIPPREAWQVLRGSSFLSYAAGMTGGSSGPCGSCSIGPPWFGWPLEVVLRWEAFDGFLKWSVVPNPTSGQEGKSRGHWCSSRLELESRINTTAYFKYIYLIKRHHITLLFKGEASHAILGPALQHHKIVKSIHS